MGRRRREHRESRTIREGHGERAQSASPNTWRDKGSKVAGTEDSAGRPNLESRTFVPGTLGEGRFAWRWALILGGALIRGGISFFQPASDERKGIKKKKLRKS